jgi:hypothetical protein
LRATIYNDVMPFHCCRCAACCGLLLYAGFLVKGRPSAPPRLPFEAPNDIGQHDEAADDREGERECFSVRGASDDVTMGAISTGTIEVFSQEPFIPRAPIWNPAVHEQSYAGPPFAPLPHEVAV